MNGSFLRQELQFVPVTECGIVRGHTLFELGISQEGISQTGI